MSSRLVAPDITSLANGSACLEGSCKLGEKAESNFVAKSTEFSSLLKQYSLRSPICQLFGVWVEAKIFSPKINNEFRERFDSNLPSEGRACRVRGATFDHLSRFGGPDKQVPPNRPLEEPARRVQSATHWSE